jgi:hypothetical protein
MRRTLLVVFLTMACASPRDPFAQLEAGDYSIVEEGRYPFTTKTLREPDTLEQFHQRIEANLSLLEEMAHSLFPDETHRLFFKYKFTSVDVARDRLIVRYFAQIPYPEIFAGYQCQFVFNLETGVLEEVFLSKIPLER